MKRLGLFILIAAVLSIFGATLRAEDSAPLADAVENRDRDATAALIESGANIDAQQVDGMTALHWAVYYDETETVRDLVAAGADVNIRNRYGVPPLSVACVNGNGQIVSMLLQAGADANATLRGGETVLMTAARTGKLGPVQELLEHGADPRAKERKGQTALMWAAAEGNAQVVDALIEAGADEQAALPSGFSPFFFAIREGHRDVVARLLDAGVDVNEPMRPARPKGKGPKTGTTALLLAVENGHFELAAALLEAGADPNDRQLGYTALHAISWVRKPLRGDGDPPPVGSGSLGSLDLVRKLVACGADVNARHGKSRSNNGRLDKTDATPFLLAAETGDLPLMRLLLELGADPNLTNVDNVTPLLAASGVGILGNGDESAGTEEEAIAAVRLLLKLGADINAVEDHGETAMHGAAYKSWTKLIRFLADHGADPEIWNRKNQRGWTPLLIAQGHRPGNFRPSAETIIAVEEILQNAVIRPLPVSD